MKKLFKYIAFALLLAVILIQCRRDDRIPYVPVNMTIYPSMPAYSKLNSIGGWMYLNAGSKGIIVRRVSSDSFIALERHCTFQPENECSKVYMDPSGLFATDTCCSSSFSADDGSVIGGPATLNLVEYQTTWDGNALTIFN